MATTPQLSYHVQAFSKLVTIMNQTHSKNISMSADDARNLHSDIFALLARIAELTESSSAAAPESISVSVDGGAFSK